MYMAYHVVLNIILLYQSIKYKFKTIQNYYVTIIKITRNNRTQWLQLKGNHDGSGAHSIYAFFVALQRASQVPTRSLTKKQQIIWHVISINKSIFPPNTKVNFK